MPYTNPISFTSTGNYGTGPDDEDDVYTVGEFRRLCRAGAFVDSDGFGEPVKDGHRDPDIWIKPSRFNKIPKDATHIVWYNR